MESADILQDRKIQCPKCRTEVVVRQSYYLSSPVYPCDVCRAALYNASGTGYTQQKFTFTCTCGFEIDKDKLGAFKFVGDIVKADSCLACAILHF
jgi:ribosomal protein L37AE/L43A